MRRLGSFTVDESRINNEIASYVTKYFEEDHTQRRKSMLLYRVVKRSVKSILAVLSLWFPHVYNLIASKKDPVQYVYANLVERFMSGDDSHIDSHRSGQRGNIINS